MAIEALILDFGEVLVRGQSAESVERMAELAGLRAGDFRERYWRHRARYDNGSLSDEDYWDLIVAGADSRPHEKAATLAELMRADAVSWSDYREEVWALTAAFRSKGGRTAILSNGVPAVMRSVRAARSLETYFDAVVVSYELGYAKPDPRIYRFCLEKLGLPAHSTLFVDDRLENLEAARREGLQTLHFTGDASVGVLRSIVGLQPQT